MNAAAAGVDGSMGIGMVVGDFLERGDYAYLRREGRECGRGGGVICIFGGWGRG